jgi:spore cortex biosynthesis protein YabQ
METQLSLQAIAFLWAIVLGAGVGALYDVFRILRILRRKNPAPAVFIEDLLFSFLSSVATALFLIRFNYGQVRLFLLIGEGLGFAFYHFTLGALVVFWARLIRRILDWLGRLLKKLFKKIKKLFIFFLKWFRIRMPKFEERSGTREKKQRRKGQARQKDEPRRAGLIGIGIGLYRRHNDRNLHPPASSNQSKKGGIGRNQSANRRHYHRKRRAQ